MQLYMIFLERAASALSEIGPAVFNGGFSTFLAFILLAASTSYVFKTFFKVSFLISFLITFCLILVSFKVSFLIFLLQKANFLC